MSPKIRKRIVSNSVLPTSKSRMVVYLLLAFYGILIILAGLKLSSITFDILNLLIGTGLLLIVPGISILGWIGVRVDDWKRIIYTVGISVVFLVAVGYVVNGFYILFPKVIPKPFTGLTTKFIFWGVIGTVFVGAILVDRGAKFGAVNIRDLIKREYALGCFLVLLAITGAHLLNVESANTLLLMLLLLIPLTIILVAIMGNQETYPLVIYFVALALEYQNALILTHLERGDASKEYFVANLTLFNGFWNPAIPMNKNSLLRLTISHPIFKHFTELSLLWEFKIIHPIILAFLPMGLYFIYKQYFDARSAYLSAVLVTFLHPFFNRLARDTRTGTALLFFVLSVLAVIDADLSKMKKTLLVMIFFIGIIISHYGVAYFALLYIGGPIIIAAGFNKIFEKDIPRNSIGVLTYLFYVVSLETWYIYISKSSVFDAGVSIISHTFTAVETFFGPDSAATQVVTKSTQSFTYSFIRIEYILLVLLSVIGYTLTMVSVRYPLPKGIKTPTIHPTIEDNYFYLFAGAGLVILILAFAPISVFGIARVFMIGVLFLPPFALVAIQGMGNLMPKLRVISFLSKDWFDSHTIFMIFLTLIFVVNSGMAGVVLQEKMTQPNLDRERIINNGDQIEVNHLYSRYLPVSTHQGTQWLIRHASNPYVVRGSVGSIDQFTEFLVYNNYTKLHRIRPVIGRSKSATDYIVVGPYDMATREFVTKPGGYQQSQTVPFSAVYLSSKDQLYDAGKFKIFTNSSGMKRS